MIHFTPHQEGGIEDIKCLYYQNSLIMWHRPLGPSNAIKRERCPSTQLFSGQAPTHSFLCYIWVSDICCHGLHFLFCLPPCSSVFSIYPVTYFLPISLIFLLFQSLHWLHSMSAQTSISYNLTSPLKSCPLACLRPQKLPPSPLWYNHPETNSWRGISPKHTWPFHRGYVHPRSHVLKMSSTETARVSWIWP